MPISARIFDHPVFKTLEQVSTLIDNELNKSPSSIAGEPEEYFWRFKKVIDLTKSRLNAAEDLVQIRTLDALQIKANQMLSELTNSLASKNQANLTNPYQFADEMLSLIAAIVIPQSTADLATINATVSSFQEVLRNKSKQLEAETQDVLQKADTTQKRLSDLEEEIKNERLNLNKVSAGFQQQFSEAQEKRLNEFNESKNKQAEELLAIRQSFADEYKTLTGNLERSGQETLGNLNELNSKAVKIVGLISDVAITGGYQETAAAEYKKAKNWKIVAVISLGLLAVFSIIAFFMPPSTQNIWYNFSSKLFVFLSVGALATYAVRQGSSHEEAERHSKRLALALAAIDPYLASMPDNERNELKKKLALRFFYFSKQQASTKQESEIIHEAFSLISEGMKLLQKKL